MDKERANKRDNEEKLGSGKRAREEGLRGEKRKVNGREKSQEERKR